MFINTKNKIVGCQTILNTALKILDSQFIQHCSSSPWPLVRQRLDYLIKWCAQRIVEENKQKIRNQKSKQKQFENGILISVNNFSFANSLTMEVINQQIVGKIDQKYKAVANAFQALGEFEFMALHKYEPKDKHARFIFYAAIKEKKNGAHFGRPFILMMRVNESDTRHIRYIVSIPNGLSIADSVVLKKIENIQRQISENITMEAFIHMRTDIEDVLALSNDGYSIQSMTKKLQNILNKRKMNETRLEKDLATEIMANGPVSSAVIIDVCAVAENRSKFDLFFKLCHDLCRKRVSGALAKRHGIIEEVEHVTSIRELWRLVSKEIEVHFTDESNVFDVDEVARNIPSYDYLTKQLSPKNEYVAKSDRYFSSLQFKLALSGRSNHVKHPDFNYTQVNKGNHSFNYHCDIN